MLDRIPNGRGDRDDILFFGYTNADATMRSYSLAYSKVGGAEGEIVRSGNAAAGAFRGVVNVLTPEPLASGAFAVGERVTVVEAPARISVFFAPSTTYADGDLLIDNGSDQVIPRPQGSTSPVVGLCTVSKTTAAAEELGQMSLLASGSAPAVGVQVTGFGVDAPVDGRYLIRTFGNHAAGETALDMAVNSGRIRNLTVKLKTAAGAGKTLTYTVMKSSDGGATFSTTALTLDITGTGLVAQSAVGLSAAVAKGDLLGIRVNSADVGAAVGSNASFQVE